MKASIGVIGLGVMGGNLALNFERNGFRVAVYNHDPAKAFAFIESKAGGKNMFAVSTLAELANSLEKPRRILAMVPAGDPVDQMMKAVEPFLEPGDIFIDGGNSYFPDTERRSTEWAGKGYHFVGMGVSGGETGALWGPSIMPGGSNEAWGALAPLLRAIAAKAVEDGEPCVTHIGPRGAGHYVKMVHNGIEYADMQLISEAYDLLSRGAGMTAAELAELFSEWNRGDLKSYLIEITAQILTRLDEESGRPLVDLILDEAQQKGTGKWTSQNSFDIGAPVPSINAAVEMRILSGLKAQRVEAARTLGGPGPAFKGDRAALVEAVHQALYAAKVAAYAQGMGMLRTASSEYDYDLNLGEIARIWRAGCIIRADLLQSITAAFQRRGDLPNLLLDESFREAVNTRQAGWREAVATAVRLGIPVMGLSSALAYFDAFRSERLPANLIQAQRDFFGAHTYRRIDREGVFHTRWEE